MDAKSHTFIPENCENCDIVNSIKQEVAILRRQIDMLNMHTIKIRKQNFVLEKKIKELEQNNIELKNIQKDKDELFALIVHDIKNPTTIIKSLVEILRNYDTTSTEQQSIIDDILVSTKQIVALSLEVSKVLSMESSAISLFFEYTNPGILVTEVAKRNAVNAKNKNQTISIDIEDELPQFHVDAVKIQEVFDNMISNSIKYTQPGGKIGIKAKLAENYIQFEFSDNGLGMSEEDLKKVFKRGVRLSAKPTGGETSSGVGLWIVKKIIEAHKGKVWIKSSIGNGSVFTIQIPIKPDTDNEEKKQ